MAGAPHRGISILPVPIILAGLWLAGNEGMVKETGNY